MNFVAAPTIEEMGQTADTGAVVRPGVSEQSPAPGPVTFGEQQSVQSAVDPDRRQGEHTGRLLPMRGAGPSSSQASAHTHGQAKPLQPSGLVAEASSGQASAHRHGQAKPLQPSGLVADASSGQASAHTHGQAKPLQPSGLVADPTLGREGDRNDGEAQGRTGQGSTGWLANHDDAAPQRTAAIGRAMQVQAAVHLENATGQAPTAEVMAMTHAQFSPGSSATAATAQGLGALPADGGLASSQALLDGNHFTAGVMRGLSAMLNQRGGVMTMRLQPPQLGELRVQMTIARGVVTAQFHAATPQAHALLEQSLAVLRSALEANGLTVERLTVHLMQTTNAQATRQEAADEQSQSSRHHSDAGEGRSRGRRDDDGEPLSHQFGSQFDHEVEAFDLPASRQPAAGVDSR
ncbi:MAG: flagellar hook-length control protein FliK [Planctomycetes bacterium]|nr:flagellar hook-length control protein FliK [Planctomycetota bacterium]